MVNKRRLRRLNIVALVAVVSLIAVACGGSADPTPVPTVAVPAGVNISEVKQLIDEAAAMAPKPLTAEEIREIVKQAVPEQPDPLTAAEIEAIVKAAIPPTPVAIPTPTRIVIPPPTAGEPRSGGILRARVSGDPTTFDEMTTQRGETMHILAPVYSNLIRESNEDEYVVEGDLAESWDISGGGVKITFHLHPNIKFSDGSPLTAEDVKFSLDRVINPPEGLASPRKGKLAAIENIEAQNPATVVANLKGPSPDFLPVLADPSFHVFSKAFTEPLDATGKGLQQSWLGSGPFTLERAVSGEIYEEARNDLYFKDGQPYLDGIKHFPISRDATTAAALETGRLDFAYQINTPSVIEGLGALPGVIIVHAASPTGESAMFFDLGNAPFNDVRFRRAISLAIDRAEFDTLLTENLTQIPPGFGLMPAGSPWNLSAEEFATYPGFNTHPALPDNLRGDVEANRAEARALLSDLGIAEGTKYQIMARADLTGFVLPAIAVCEQLKKIGLACEVELIEAGVFYPREGARDFELVFHSMGFSGSYPDAILGEGWISGGRRNYSQWSNPAIDELFAQQSPLLDDDKRKDIVLELTRLHLDNLYQLYLSQNIFWSAYESYFKGWFPHGGNNANFHFDNVWLEK